MKLRTMNMVKVFGFSQRPVYADTSTHVHVNHILCYKIPEATDVTFR